MHSRATRALTRAHPHSYTHTHARTHTHTHIHPRTLSSCSRCCQCYPEKPCGSHVTWWHFPYCRPRPICRWGPGWAWGRRWCVCMWVLTCINVSTYMCKNESSYRVWFFIYVCAYTHTRTHEEYTRYFDNHLYVYMHRPIWITICIYASVYQYIYIHIFTHSCILQSIHIYISTNTHENTHTHTHTHTTTHTNIYVYI